MSTLKLPDEAIELIAGHLGTTVAEAPTIEALSAKLNSLTNGQLHLAYEDEGEVLIYGTAKNNERIDADIMFEELSDKKFWDELVEDVQDELTFVNESPASNDEYDIEADSDGDSDGLSEQEILELRKESKIFAEVDKAFVRAITEIDRVLTQAEKILDEEEAVENNSARSQTEA